MDLFWQLKGILKKSWAWMLANKLRVGLCRGVFVYSAAHTFFNHARHFLKQSLISWLLGPDYGGYLLVPPLPFKFWILWLAIIKKSHLYHLCDTAIWSITHCLWTSLLAPTWHHIGGVLVSARTLIFVWYYSMLCVLFQSPFPKKSFWPWLNQQHLHQLVPWQKMQSFWTISKHPAYY